MKYTQMYISINLICYNEIVQYGKIIIFAKQQRNFVLKFFLKRFILSNYTVI